MPPCTNCKPRGLSVKQIVQSWVTAAKPSTAEGETAKRRLAICGACPFQSVILGVKVCKKCGCPLSKKVYLKGPGGCPLGKWP